MDQSVIGPHLTAELCAPDMELDLSATKPFNLKILVTLHAPKPVFVFTVNIFLSSPAALHCVGIDFLRQGGDGTPEPRSTIDVNRGYEPDRSWNANDFLVLEPETPLPIDDPFNSTTSPATAKTRHFDFRLLLSTASLKTGATYKAMLPSATKVSWWRWATPHEIRHHVPDLKLGRSAASTALRRWWNGGDDNEQGVPVLPEGEQLPVRISGAGVFFTCVGQFVERPGAQA